MKLLGSIKNKITMVENFQNVSHLEITERLLAQCNVVNNDYQQDSRVSHTFVPNTLFGQLLDISSKNFLLLKTLDSEFPYIGV